MASGCLSPSSAVEQQGPGLSHPTVCEGASKSKVGDQAGRQLRVKCGQNRVPPPKSSPQHRGVRGSIGQGCVPSALCSKLGGLVGLQGWSSLTGVCRPGDTAVGLVGYECED